MTTLDSAAKVYGFSNMRTPRGLHIGIMRFGETSSVAVVGATAYIEFYADFSIRHIAIRIVACQAGRKTIPACLTIIWGESAT
ncbi:hypothetical protein [Crateriforma conspicua]|uniref:hypothetical protein n=1 Tax=Crateriforma conspicua TaxID=2527996 RepID=UPI0011B3A870|nr:hypothetical protein [Crateriforma conspicua]